MLAIALGLLAAIPVAGPIMLMAATAAGSILGKILTNKPLAFTIAGFLALGGAELHGRHAANANCTVKLASQVNAAATARRTRDKRIAAELAKKYEPIIGQLQSESATLQKQVDDYALKEFAKPKPKPGEASCELGDAADVQLRPRRK